MKKRDFESKRGSFQEIGAKWSKFSKFRAKNSTFRGIKLPRKGGKWLGKGGKVLNLASKRGSDPPK